MVFTISNNIFCFFCDFGNIFGTFGSNGNLVVKQRAFLNGFEDKI